MLVFEVTRVERKKRGRKAAEFNETEKENHNKTLAERKKARNINFRSKKNNEILILKEKLNAKNENIKNLGKLINDQLKDEPNLIKDITD